MSYYSINVALHGRHYFATAKHSITDEAKASAVFHDIFTRFPADQGFLVDVTYYREHGVNSTPKRLAPGFEFVKDDFGHYVLASRLDETTLKIHSDQIRDSDSAVVTTTAGYRYKRVIMAPGESLFTFTQI